MRRAKYWIYFFAAAFIVACGSTSNMMAPAENDLIKVQTDFPDVTVADLQQGFSLYKMNCGGCHMLYKPTEKTKEQWAKVLPEMFGKTSLKAQEKIRITQYLYAKAPAVNHTATSNN
jgi:hypothetical protein